MQKGTYCNSGKGGNNGVIKGAKIRTPFETPMSDSKGGSKKSSKRSSSKSGSKR